MVVIVSTILEYRACRGAFEHLGLGLVSLQRGTRNFNVAKIPSQGSTKNIEALFFVLTAVHWSQLGPCHMWAAVQAVGSYHLGNAIAHSQTRNHKGFWHALIPYARPVVAA